MAPYPDDKATRGIPAPSAKLSDIGVRRWENDFWNRIVLAALEGHPDTVDLSGFRGFDQPAASQYAATTPELLRLFDKHNQGRPTHDQVRPFNFLLAFQAKPCVGTRMERMLSISVHRNALSRCRSAASGCILKGSIEGRR